MFIVSKLYIIVILFNLLSTCYIRLFMSSLVDFYYNKNTIRKIKKDETFKDKILFSKYKTKIPKLFYAYYYTILTFNIISIIIYAFFKLIPILNSYEFKIGQSIIICNIISIIIMEIPFWQWGRARGWKFDRWLKK